MGLAGPELSSWLHLALIMFAFESLPIEIVLNIIANAVRILVIDDSASAFATAIVCRATFTAAAPYLYASLVIRRADFHTGGHPENYNGVLKHVKHLYISGERLDDDWGVHLLRAWWPQDGTKAFVDAPLRIIQKALSGMRTSNFGGVTGLRVVYGDIDVAFCSDIRLSARWTVHLTHLTAYIPTFDDPIHGAIEQWSNNIFAAAPSLAHFGLQSNDYDEVDDEPAFVTGVETIARRLLGHKAVKDSREMLLLSQLCFRVSSAATTDTIKSGLRGVVDDINDDRLKIWIDERLDVKLIRGQWLNLDEELDAEDVKSRWDFWAPEDRPWAVVYRAASHTIYA